MLPIVLNKAVRVLPVLLREDKEYICVMRLHGAVDEEELKGVIGEFVGPIYQRPPLRSAVKRALRIRRIYSIEVLEMSGRDVLMHVWCEAGTYMRKLCHDIGEVLGVGAHMQELRRVRAGSMTEGEHLVTLHDLVDAYHFWKEEGIERFIRRAILPVEYAVKHLPRIVIRDSAVDAVARGAPLAVPGILQVETGIKVGSIVAIYTLKGELVAIGKARMRTEQIMSSKKGVAVEPEHVLMDPGTYPSMWKKHKKI